MSKRSYNILFHTHTVSGIIISVLLYVIFFAGSFAFFRDEIIAWERNEPVKKTLVQQIDLNRMLSSLEEDYNLYSRDILFKQYYETNRIGVSLSAPKDTTVQGARKFFYMNVENMNTSSYQESYSIGEFLYRLHFFAQLNIFGVSGYILAGLVAFFFLFAIVTGVLVHWDKIVSNFYQFRPRTKWKTLWTDAHTALGVIGLPFQFVFAVSGTFLIFASIAFAPSIAAVIYEGDTQEMRADYLESGFKPDFQLTQERVATPDLNAFVDEAKTYFSSFRVNNIKIYNYGDASMHFAIKGHPYYNDNFTGKGIVVFNAQSGKVMYKNNPIDAPYKTEADQVMTRLHFGDFGGLGLRIVYFVLGIISCFVILSGILIWLTARNKKHIEKKKRVFNKWMGHVFLSTCLGMYPVTAFTFVAVKLFVHEYNASRMDAIYQIFFYSWLAVILFFTFKKDDYLTNKWCLISGSVIGIFVPVVNGIISGNWPWVTFSQGYYDIFFVDAFWVVLSVTTFIIGIRLEKEQLFKYQNKKQKKKKKDTKLKAEPVN